MVPLSLFSSAHIKTKTQTQQYSTIPASFG